MPYHLLFFKKKNNGDRIRNTTTYCQLSSPNRLDLMTKEKEIGQVCPSISYYFPNGSSNRLCRV